MNKSLEALWGVVYGDVSSLDQFNGGVVVFETNRIFGGDSCFYYTGTYNSSGADLSAQVKITHFSGPDLTAFGLQVSESLQIQIKATREGDKIFGTMWPVDQPDNCLAIIFVPLEDVPNP